MAKCLSVRAKVGHVWKSVVDGLNHVGFRFGVFGPMESCDRDRDRVP
jgi:hypothetical protein